MTNQPQPKSINSAWELIGALIELASGMTGDQFKDRVLVDRGKGYVQAFKREFPYSVYFINSLIEKDVPALVKTLSSFIPQASQNPNVPEFLTRLKNSLNSK